MGEHEGDGEILNEDHIIKVGITYDTKTGAVGVKSEHMHDKVLLYGILESAKFAIVSVHLQAQPKNKIISGGILPFVRKLKRR